jgi:TusA-related sulfurtransferase
MPTINEIRIEARGMRCPRPIVELAKARRQATAGTIVVITADDLAFESDVKAWCETTRNSLKSLEKSGDVVRAVIELTGGI